MSDYVPVESDLQLPPALRGAEARVRAFDPALRLRQSAVRMRRRTGIGFVLERKVRYSLPVTSTKDRDVQIAARDGYEIITHVHVSHLMRPDSIIEELRSTGDLATQTANARYHELIAAQGQAKSDRRATRLDNLKAFYRESFGILDRLGDPHSHAERTRLNNAGGVERFNITDHRRIKPEDAGLTLDTPSAGETPAKELSDEHTPGKAARREDGQLHHQADGRQAGDRIH